MLVVAALRFADPHPGVAPLTGAVRAWPQAGGAGEADRCALEYALRLAGELGGRCLAVTAGPAAADRMLREALAAGADAVLRVDVPGLDPLADDGSGTAAALAAALARQRPDLVLCGDHSVDRGTGATPAFLAGLLGAAQALGLVELSADPAGGRELRAVRRLDGGRRERLAVPLPAVCSVEPTAVRLRRAPLPRVLAAADAPIPVLPAVAAGRGGRVRVGSPGAYRPRAKPLAPPAGDDPRSRILALTGALAERSQPRVVTPGTAAQAADELLAYLRRYLPDLPSVPGLPSVPDPPDSPDSRESSESSEASR